MKFINLMNLINLITLILKKLKYSIVTLEKKPRKSDYNSIAHEYAFKYSYLRKVT